MIAIILYCILFVLTFYYVCIRPMDYWKKRGVPQGKPAWFFGDNLENIMKRETCNEAVVRYYNRHPGKRYFGIYQLVFPILVLRDPDLIKQMAVKDFEYFSDHASFIPDDSDPLWSRGLFALKGQKWREMRPVISPTFTSSKIKAMYALIAECADTFIEYFKKEQKDGQEIVEVEMRDVLSRYGNDVIASVAFGLKVDSLKDRDNDFYLMGLEATEFSTAWRKMKIFGYFFLPKLYELLKVTLFSSGVSKFFTDIINQTIKIREQNSIIRPDVIHLLLEARKGGPKQAETTSVETGFATVIEANFEKPTDFEKKDFSNIDIAAQAMVFYFAGFDSISTVMSLLAYELAINPEVQKKLRDEIEETARNSEGRPTYEALMRMKYMDMVVSEALRKWPNFIIVDRKCNKPYTIKPVRPDEKPVHVQKGDLIWIPIHGLHYSPEHYPDPYKFDPERFSDENKHKIKPYTYMPFGVGPRSCIGSRLALLEIKTMFYHLLLHFELVPVARTNIPVNISKNSFNLQAEVGNWLGFKPIKQF